MWIWSGKIKKKKCKRIQVEGGEEVMSYGSKDYLEEKVRGRELIKGILR